MTRSDKLLQSTCSSSNQLLGKLSCEPRGPAGGPPVSIAKLTLPHRRGVEPGAAEISMNVSLCFLPLACTTRTRTVHVPHRW